MLMAGKYQKQNVGGDDTASEMSPKAENEGLHFWKKCDSFSKAALALETY